MLLPKVSSRRVNSIGKIHLVEALAAMSLSASKYCRVSVFWSTLLATVKMRSSAAA